MDRLMDITNIRTFLAVVETGSFVSAAERVHVTQSTVSMRIRSLEEQLGVKVFERNKSGASLTNSGREFAKHAVAMARIWDQACLEVTDRTNCLGPPQPQSSEWAGK